MDNDLVELIQIFEQEYADIHEAFFATNIFGYPFQDLFLRRPVPIGDIQDYCDRYTELIPPLSTRIEQLENDIILTQSPLLNPLLLDIRRFKGQIHLSRIAFNRGMILLNENLIENQEENVGENV